MSDKCERFQGLPHKYQEEAIGRYVHVWQTPLGAYAYVLSTCETTLCLNVDHLQVKRPHKLAYPRGTCVYCGLYATSRDHLEPVTWTGEASRRYVVTVPACGECNSVLNDSFAPTIPERRALVQERLRKRYKRVLQREEYTPAEIDEFEGMLRTAVLDGIEEKRIVIDRLEWPADPNYDLRALEKSDLEPESVSELLSLPYTKPN